MRSFINGEEEKEQSFSNGQEIKGQIYNAELNIHSSGSKELHKKIDQLNQQKDGQADQSNLLNNHYSNEEIDLNNSEHKQSVSEES